jgi:hypothetical protein
MHIATCSFPVYSQKQQLIDVCFFLGIFPKEMLSLSYLLFNLSIADNNYGENNILAPAACIASKEIASEYPINMGHGMTQLDRAFS